ncbi:ABC transporter permease, partial [Microbacterium paraoxydans]
VVQIGWGMLWLPVAILLQAVLLVGLGLLVAPLCVLYTDLERTTALILRAMFYATPIIYNVTDLPGIFQTLGAFNPLAGIFMLYRMPFFPDQWNPFTLAVSVAMCLLILALGVWAFRRLERPVLKEL